MDFLEAALGIGSFGLSLFGSISARNAARRQEASYNEQAALNRKIGQFNAMIAERTGQLRMQAAIDMTKRTLATQMVEFSNRGISLEGSPMLVLGETQTMGEANAQEEYFNSQVNKINALFGAWTASKTAESNAENARYTALSSMVNTVKTVAQGLNLAKSMMNSSTAENSSMVNNSSTVNETVKSMGVTSTASPVSQYYQFLLR